MSDSLVVCDVDPELKEKLKKFRFRKETNNAAIMMKVDKDRQLVVLEEEFQMTSFTHRNSFFYTIVRYPGTLKLKVGNPKTIVGYKQDILNNEGHTGVDISPNELGTELPERQPRFVVYSYKYIHDDGRVSYPLCFIFSSPVGCKPEQQMMYAGSKNRLVQAAELTKVFEIRSTEDLTEQWLRERLAFFR